MKRTSVLNAEEPFDMPGEVLVNLAVAGHRLPASVGRVPINVVPGAWPKQLASSSIQLPDEFPALHTSTSLTW
jgi:hypothetical protein